MRNQAAINKKISLALKGKPWTEIKRNALCAHVHSEKTKQQMSDSHKIAWSKRSFDQLGKRAKRLKIIEEQDVKCLWCGLSEWRNQPLLLEMDHIDGNRQNDVRENLRVLCPNCHSQTATYNFVGRKHTNKAKELLRLAGIGNTSGRRNKVG